jgi:hypothetical protein
LFAGTNVEVVVFYCFLFLYLWFDGNVGLLASTLLISSASTAVTSEPSAHWFVVFLRWVLTMSRAI